MSIDAKLAELEIDIIELKSQLVNAVGERELAIRNQITATRIEKAALINSQNNLTGSETQGYIPYILHSLHAFFSALFTYRTKPEDKVPEASYWLHMDETCGNAIAVSNKLLLCALHSEVPEGTPVELVDIRGTSRTGKVIKSVFESMKFDMTLIQIDDGQPRLPYCIPVHRKAIESSQDIKVIGLITAYNGDSILATHNSQVFAIEPDSSLFRATYYGAEGFSGAGIIVVTDNNRYELVGVHVATHDVTERPPVIKKSKSGNGAAAADSVEDAVSSLSSGLHRHMAYCLASEPFRIKKIFELLS